MIVKMKVKDLNYCPYNPRRITAEDFEKLSKSIKQFGLVEPLVFNKRTNYVIGGNQRLKALNVMGIEDVDVFVVDLPLKQEKILNIALNKISGKFELRMVKDVIDDFSLDDSLLAGFDETEIQKFLSVEKFNPEEDMTAIDVSEIVENPVWLTIRTKKENEAALNELYEKALALGFMAEVSYEQKKKL